MTTIKPETKIISGFPGIGKSFMVEYIKENYPNLKVSDSDSSLFSWLYKDGIKTDERNPNFVEDYIKHIDKLVEEEYDFIFVSSHKEIRDALKGSKHKYSVRYAYPDVSLKEEYLKRYIERGSPEGLINAISENWNKNIKEMESNLSRWETIKLGSEEFLMDKIKLDYQEAIEKSEASYDDISKSCALEIVEFLVAGDFENKRLLVDLAYQISMNGISILASDYVQEMPLIEEEIESSGRWHLYGYRIYQNGDFYIKESFTDPATENQEGEVSEYHITRPVEETIIIRKWV